MDKEEPHSTIRDVSPFILSVEEAGLDIEPETSIPSKNDSPPFVLSVEEAELEIEPENSDSKPDSSTLDTPEYAEVSLEDTPLQSYPSLKKVLKKKKETDKQLSLFDNFTS